VKKHDLDARKAARSELMVWGGAMRKELARECVAAGHDCDMAEEAARIARDRAQAAPESATLRAAACAAEAEAEICARAAADMKKRLEEAKRRHDAMDRRVRRLGERAQVILRLRYVRRLGWEAIARRCYLSPSAARYCERAAVDKIAKMMASEKKS
jgi:DNA-directed RNA polymerase specialized sigma subunit